MEEEKFGVIQTYLGCLLTHPIEVTMNGMEFYYGNARVRTKTRQ